MEPMRAQVLCLDGIGRRSRVHREVVESCSLTLLSLRPLRALRSPRSHAANAKRSLPQSAQSYGEKDTEPMRAQMLVFWCHRASFEVLAWGLGALLSDPAFSASSARSAVSAVLRCERQPVSTAERAELWGEGCGADGRRSRF